MKIKEKQQKRSIKPELIFRKDKQKKINKSLVRFNKKRANPNKQTNKSKRREITTTEIQKK